MRKTLEAIPSSQFRRRRDTIKPEMIVRNASKDIKPTVILAKAKEATCSQCIFWSGHTPAGPCGGFTQAVVTGARGTVQDVTVMAGDGFVMNEQFATWAQGPGRNGRKWCATDKQIDV